MDALVSLVAPGVIKIFTDHQALQYFATKRMLNARQARWIETLAMVGFEIHYRPGKQNVVADALSRKAQDVQLQKALKELNRSQILIPATQFAGGTTGGAAIAAGAAGGDDPTIAIYTPVPQDKPRPQTLEMGKPGFTSLRSERSKQRYQTPGSKSRVASSVTMDD
ncbi:retrotransposon nucleocapsid protein [Hirsutella rhossiliensis]